MGSGPQHTFYGPLRSFVLASKFMCLASNCVNASCQAQVLAAPGVQSHAVWLSSPC